MSVRKLKVGEFGRIIPVNAGEDISGADSYTLVFTKPNGTTVNKTATLGDEEITVVDIDGVSQTYAADEYVNYTIETGLIDAAGRWSLRLLAPSESVSVPGDIVYFDVIN
jgi:hypothetical protein